MRHLLQQFRFMPTMTYVKKGNDIRILFRNSTDFGK